jgi:Protein of unknown function (DUF3352)
MSLKKSNLLVPVGIGAAILVAGGAAGYLYLRGTFSDANTPLASAKVVPDEALMTGFVSGDAKAWSQLQQFGTPAAQNAIAKGLAEFNQQVFVPEKIDYAKDIQPWLGSVMFAMLPPDASQSPSQPNFLVVVGIKDKISAFNFANKIKSQGGDKIKETDYKGIKIMEDASSPQPSYTAILGEHLVLSSQKKSVEAAIDTFKGQPSFATKSDSKTLLTNGVELKNSVAQVYIPDYPALIQQLVAGNGDLSQIPPETLNQLKQVKSVAMGVGIDNAGVRMKTIAKLNPGANQIQYKPSPGKVVAQFPLETIALATGSGISQIWTAVVEQSKTNPQVQQQIDQARQQVKTSTDLDLDKDILSWMDDEFAIGAIASNQGVLAPIGVGGAIVVKTSDRATAEATLTKINALVAKDNSVTIGQRNVGGKTVTEFTVPQQGAWVGYGWLDDNSLLVSIGSPIFDAMATNTKPLDNSESFKAIAGTLPQPNAGYFYLDWEKAMAVIEKNLPPDQKNSIPPETTAMLQSIRGFGVTASQPDASTSQMEMILALKPKTGK